jgi:hypothetical protein
MENIKLFSLPKYRFNEVNDYANKIKQAMNRHSGGTNYLVKVSNERENGVGITNAKVIQKSTFPNPPKIVASIQIDSRGKKEIFLDEEVKKVLNSA